MKSKLVHALSFILSGCCIGTLFLWWLGQTFSVGLDCHLTDKIFSEIDCGAGRMEFSVTRSYGEPFGVCCTGDFVNTPKCIDFAVTTGFYSNVIVGHHQIFEAFNFDHEPATVAVNNWYASIDIPYWFLVLLFAILPAWRMFSHKT